jgi:hypothetical protein
VKRGLNTQSAKVKKEGVSVWPCEGEEEEKMTNEKEIHKNFLS